MKRLVAIIVLLTGITSVTPIAFTSAQVPAYDELDQHCRSRLGYGPTEVLHTVFLDQLRRCISNTRKQYQQAADLERRLIRYDQRFWRNAAYGQEILRESRRSLHDRVQHQEAERRKYYHTTTLSERHANLLEHRASRRALLQERERQIIVEREEKLSRWREAISNCHYVQAGAERQACMNDLLSR